MINVDYNREKNLTKVDLKNLKTIKDYLPIKIQFKNIITNKIEYETQITDYHWASWCGAELITDILFFTSNEKLLYKYEWDVTINGDEIEKMLWFYLKSRQLEGLKSNGLVIGTHDGQSGHWIYPVKHNLSQVTLVEGGDKQFIELVKNYKEYSNVKTLNHVVTTDGANVTWYQGGNGFADTIKKETIEYNFKMNYDKTHYLWIDNISEINKSSVSINELMSKETYDWLHLDVEGIDGDLILSLEYKPNVIIYESMNLNENVKEKLNLWFFQNLYSTLETSGNTIAIKNY